MPRRMGRPGLIRTVGRTAVVAGTATAVSGGVRRRGAEREQAAAAQQQAAAQTQDQAQQPAPSPAMSIDDQVAKIKALGQLKDEGLLTEEEFAAEKAKILAS